jgi:hypothetical protein
LKKAFDGFSRTEIVEDVLGKIFCTKKYKSPREAKTPKLRAYLLWRLAMNSVKEQNHRKERSGMQLDLKSPVEIIDQEFEENSDEEKNPMKKMVKASLKKKLEEEI